MFNYWRNCWSSRPRPRSRAHREAAFLVGQHQHRWSRTPTHSWRLEPDKGGASSALGDIGSHWCDLAQHISGCESPRCSATSPPSFRNARSRAARAKRSRLPVATSRSISSTSVEDLASVLLRFDNGARGLLGRSGVCRHKNDLTWRSRPNSSLRWRQEHQNELWLDHRDKPNEMPGERHRTGRSTRGRAAYAHLPGGHQESWRGAFCNLMRDIYGFIAEGKKAARSASPGVCDVRRRLPRQLHRRSDPRELEEGQRVDEGEQLNGDTGVRSEVHEGRVLTAALQE